MRTVSSDHLRGLFGSHRFPRIPRFKYRSKQACSLTQLSNVNTEAAFCDRGCGGDSGLVSLHVEDKDSDQ